MEKVYAAFLLGDETYGVPVENVKIIINMQEITPIPKTPDYVKGVINLRGKITPVLDMKTIFNLPSEGEDKIIVMEVNDKEFGIIVDDVSDVLRLDDAAIEPVPEMIAGTIDARYLTGIAKLDEKLVTIIEVEKLFTEDELSLIGSVG